MHTLLAACGAAAPAAHKGQRGDSSSSATSWMTGAAAGRRVSSIALESDSPPPPCIPPPTAPPRGHDSDWTADNLKPAESCCSAPLSASVLFEPLLTQIGAYGACMSERDGGNRETWCVCMRVRVCLPDWRLLAQFVRLVQGYDDRKQLKGLFWFQFIYLFYDDAPRFKWCIPTQKTVLFI